MFPPYQKKLRIFYHRPAEKLPGRFTVIRQNKHPAYCGSASRMLVP